MGQLTRQLLALALAFVALPNVSAVPAHADDGDPVGFIKSLDNDGIPYRDALDAIHFGYVVCHMVDQGNTPSQLANDALTRGTTYTPFQIQLLIGDAITFLCPQHVDEIPEGWG